MSQNLVADRKVSSEVSIPRKGVGLNWPIKLVILLHIGEKGVSRKRRLIWMVLQPHTSQS